MLRILSRFLRGLTTLRGATSPGLGGRGRGTIRVMDGDLDESVRGPRDLSADEEPIPILLLGDQGVRSPGAQAVQGESTRLIGLDLDRPARRRAGGGDADLGVRNRPALIIDDAPGDPRF